MEADKSTRSIRRYAILETINMTPIAKNVTKRRLVPGAELSGTQ